MRFSRLTTSIIFLLLLLGAVSADCPPDCPVDEPQTQATFDDCVNDPSCGLSNLKPGELGKLTPDQINGLDDKQYARIFGSMASIPPAERGNVLQAIIGSNRKQTFVDSTGLGGLDISGDVAFDYDGTNFNFGGKSIPSSNLKGCSVSATSSDFSVSGCPTGGSIEIKDQAGQTQSISLPNPESSFTVTDNKVTVKGASGGNVCAGGKCFEITAPKGKTGDVEITTTAEGTSIFGNNLNLKDQELGVEYEFGSSQGELLITPSSVKGTNLNLHSGDAHINAEGSSWTYNYKDKNPPLVLSAGCSVSATVGKDDQKEEISYKVPDGKKDVSFMVMGHESFGPAAEHELKAAFDTEDYHTRMAKINRLREPPIVIIGTNNRAEALLLSTAPGEYHIGEGENEYVISNDDSDRAFSWESTNSPLFKEKERPHVKIYTFSRDIGNEFKVTDPSGATVTVKNKAYGIDQINTISTSSTEKPSELIIEPYHHIEEFGAVMPTSGRDDVYISDGKGYLLVHYDARGKPEIRINGGSGTSYEELDKQEENKKRASELLTYWLVDSDVYTGENECMNDACRQEALRRALAQPQVREIFENAQWPVKSGFDKKIFNKANIEADILKSLEGSDVLAEKPEPTVVQAAASVDLGDVPQEPPKKEEPSPVVKKPLTQVEEKIIRDGFGNGDSIGKGDKGPAVDVWQNWLLEQDFLSDEEKEAIRKEKGTFGSATESATAKFEGTQYDHTLTSTYGYGSEYRVGRRSLCIAGGRTLDQCEDVGLNIAGSVGAVARAQPKPKSGVEANDKGHTHELRTTENTVTRNVVQTEDSKGKSVYYVEEDVTDGDTTRQVYRKATDEEVKRWQDTNTPVSIVPIGAEEKAPEVIPAPESDAGQKPAISNDGTLGEMMPQELARPDATTISPGSQINVEGKGTITVAGVDSDGAILRDDENKKYVKRFDGKGYMPAPENPTSVEVSNQKNGEIAAKDKVKRNLIDSGMSQQDAAIVANQMPVEYKNYGEDPYSHDGFNTYTFEVNCDAIEEKYKGTPYENQIPGIKAVNGC